MKKRNVCNVRVIAAIDREVGLESMAEETGLTIDELLQIMAKVAETFTVFDINYLIKQASDSEIKSRLQSIQQTVNNHKILRMQQKELIIKYVAEQKSLEEINATLQIDKETVLRLMHDIVKNTYLEMGYLTAEATGNIKKELKAINEEARTWRLRRKHPDSDV